MFYPDFVGAVTWFFSGSMTHLGTELLRLVRSSRAHHLSRLTRNGVNC